MCYPLVAWNISLRKYLPCSLNYVATVVLLGSICHCCLTFYSNHLNRGPRSVKSFSTLPLSLNLVVAGSVSPPLLGPMDTASPIFFVKMVLHQGQMGSPGTVGPAISVSVVTGLTSPSYQCPGIFGSSFLSSAASSIWNTAICFCVNIQVVV